MNNVTWAEFVWVGISFWLASSVWLPLLEQPKKTIFMTFPVFFDSLKILVLTASKIPLPIVCVLSILANQFEDFLVRLPKPNPASISTFSRGKLSLQFSCLSILNYSPSNCNRIRAPSCFLMIDERLKGLLRLKAHLAPCWGPISCPCAGSRAATMQMRRSRQWMTIMQNGCEKVLETWQQGQAGNHF